MIQLQNFVSLTTSGTSGAATLSNGVLNVPNYDTSGSAWVDYSATSTIVGWSSFTTKIIRYRIIGKQMFVSFFLSGTSNSISLTFTLPQQNKNIDQMAYIYGVDNGVTRNQTYAIIQANSSTVTCYEQDSILWTNLATKTVRGQLYIELA